jgi:hypothetical protein
LASPSGAGKTLSALLLASGLGEKIALVDTERGSAQLYSHVVDFDVMELNPPFSPDRYIQAIKDAEEGGYDVLILDSITHEWNGSGGILELIDALTRSKYKGNSYAAWNEGTPKHRAFIDAILQSNLHIIATMRAKAAYVEGERNGKKTIEKVGSAPEQRDGIEYEFTTVLDISLDGHIASASKDRTGLFDTPRRITKDDGKRFLDWLNAGEDAPSIIDAQPEVRESRVADHLAAIEAAATLDELKKSFEDARAWAKAERDQLALDVFILTKDKRKRAVEAPQESAA